MNKINKKEFDVTSKPSILNKNITKLTFNNTISNNLYFINDFVKLLNDHNFKYNLQGLNYTLYYDEEEQLSNLDRLENIIKHARYLLNRNYEDQNIYNHPIYTLIKIFTMKIQLDRNILCLAEKKNVP